MLFFFNLYIQWTSKKRKTFNKKKYQPLHFTYQILPQLFLSLNQMNIINIYYR